jgi:thiazole synthase ThiGH ThiG subunit
MFTTAGVAFCAAAASPLSMARANAGAFTNGIATSAANTGSRKRYITTSSFPPRYTKRRKY